MPVPLHTPHLAVADFPVPNNVSVLRPSPSHTQQRRVFAHFTQNFLDEDFEDDDVVVDEDSEDKL